MSTLKIFNMILVLRFFLGPVVTIGKRLNLKVLVTIINKYSYNSNLHNPNLTIIRTMSWGNVQNPSHQTNAIWTIIKPNPIPTLLKSFCFYNSNSIQLYVKSNLLNWVFYKIFLLTSPGFPQNISSIKTDTMHLRIRMLTWSIAWQANCQSWVIYAAIHKIERFSNSNFTVCLNWLWDPSLFKASCGFRVYLAVAKKDEVYIQAFHWLFQGLIPAFFEKNHEIIMLDF